MMMATVSAVAFVVYSCGGKNVVAPSLDLSSTPVMTVDNMLVVQSENGVLKLRMEAPVMERYDHDSLTFEEFPEGFTAYAYNEGGQLETTIVSDNARHTKTDDKEETWAAFGNVVVNNIIKHETMETDTIYWNQSKETIYTDCYVRMYSPDGFMQGYGMESDQRARNSKILKPFNSYGVVVKDSTEVLVDSVNFIGPMPKKR